MRDIKEMVLDWYLEEIEDDEEISYCEANLTSISSDEDIDGKVVTYSEIYKDTNTGRYFKAWQQRTNSGYWGDSEEVDSGCYEVEPQIITKTIYVAIK